MSFLLREGAWPLSSSENSCSLVVLCHWTCAHKTKLNVRNKQNKIPYDPHVQSTEQYYDSFASFLLKTWSTCPRLLDRCLQVGRASCTYKVWFSVLFWSFLRRQMWTCCQSPLMSHPILIITSIFIPHPLARASAQFSVPLAPLLSSHQQFPSSTTTWGATTCPLPPPKTQRRRTSLNVRDCRAIEGLCE